MMAFVVSHLEDPTTDAPETTAMLEKIDAPPAVASSGILGHREAKRIVVVWTKRNGWCGTHALLVSRNV